MICKKCNQPQIKFGLYKCKNCRDLYHLKWRTKNRNHVNQGSKDWVEKNKEKRKQTLKKYESKPEFKKLRREYISSYVLLNKQKRLDYQRQHRALNPNLYREKKNRRRANLANVEHHPYKAIRVFERDKFECRYCGKEATCLDHIHPISRGGADAEWNLNSACGPCNTSKGNKTLEEWIIMKLG